MNLSQQIADELSQVRAGFADGHVIHFRKQPKQHRFKYNMCWCLFNLDQLEHWLQYSRLWQYNKFGVFSLYAKDYISAENKPIKEKICHYLSAQTGQDFDGQIFLFTHPRFLGYGFNSVNFYFCYQNNRLEYIVSEINNTPWGEKHLYFHDCSTAKLEKGTYSFNFAKQFHISPFLEMDMKYQWDFTVSPEKIVVKMQVDKNNVNVINVYLDTKITPVMENNVNSFLLKRPFQPWKMSIGIYWQAFKLWLKKIPLYGHPEKN